MALPPERENRKRLVFFAAAALAIVVIAASWSSLKLSLGRVAGDFLYPYLISFRLTADSLSDQSLLVFSRRELARQLEEMRSENRRLAAQSASASELLVENDHLRRMLKLAPPPSWRYTNAEVILRDPRFWNERFTIDRGRADGIALGASAMSTTMDGQLIFVGVVDKVNRHTSEVITVFNSDLRISAALPISGAVGVINPSERQAPADQVDIGFLPVSPRYVIDEILLTSGLEQNIPPGVKIGNLARIQRVDSLFFSDIFLRGTFVPAAQLNSIRFLVIADRLNPIREKVDE
jgi:rod shape-determining protein MreC